MHTKSFYRWSFSLCIGMALLGGCRDATPPKTTVAVAPPAAPAPTPPVTAPPEVKPQVPATPIKDRVEAFLTEQRQATHPLLPAGVRLLHSDLTDGVATLDFSSEFNGLGSLGDSVEGAAQKALCAALASVPGVEKLKVTVEGKPYDSQMADWSTPFPVRAETVSREERGSRE